MFRRCNLHDRHRGTMQFAQWTKGSKRLRGSRAAIPLFLCRPCRPRLGSVFLAGRVIAAFRGQPPGVAVATLGARHCAERNQFRGRRRQKPARLSHKCQLLDCRTYLNAAIQTMNALAEFPVKAVLPAVGMFSSAATFPSKVDRVLQPVEAVPAPESISMP